MRNRLFALLTLALAAGAAACDRLRAAVGAEAPLHGAAYATPEPTPPLRLPRARLGGVADTFDLGREIAAGLPGAGRAALVFFGYTHCPDVCPTTLADWKRVKGLIAAGDPADTARVRFVFVTVDPERDSAAAVARYVGQFDPGFVGLAGTRAAVDAAQAAWHVSSYREPAAGTPNGTPNGRSPNGPPGGGDYAVSHPAQVFLVGPDGRLRTIYPLGAPAADVAADLRTVLRGG